MAMLRSVLLFLPAALGQEYEVGQCLAKPDTKYQNCWGDDLEWAKADSIEECCEKCASIDNCEFFTYDVWNHDGKAQNYCFFKHGCSNPVHSSTAISGSLKRKSTTTAFTTTSSAKHTTTSAIETTSTTMPAASSTSSAAPVSTTSSTSGDAKPQCGAPHSVASLGGAGGQLQNVSSKEACCASCEAPACSYVTYGRYKHLQEEVWACYHHSSDRNATAALRSRQSGAFLTLYDDENEESCAALGLSGCAGAAVFGPGPQPPMDAGWPTGAFVGAGVASFLVSVPVGYLVGKKLSFGIK